MAGIAMCTKEDCPSFNQCYRAQATPNIYMQSYMAFDNKGKDKCIDFISIEQRQPELLTCTNTA